MSTNQVLEQQHQTAVKSIFTIEPSAIKIGKEIGKGAFSVVYAGEFNKKHVAVKCQPKDSEGNIPPYVLKEVQILQKLQHPRLLEFIGAADNRRAKQIWILSEHSNNGDVDILLKAIRKGTVAHLGWPTMIQIALDAASGIAFLHGQHIVHRDIKSSNILLDDKYHAKLCDFGFATNTPWIDVSDESRANEEDVDALGKVRRKSYCGTDAYMAPEMFLDEDYNESVDIFSFGVVLMELLCCRQGNADGFLMRLPQHKFRICVSEFHEALPKSCPPALAALAEQCVAFEPSERPTCDVVVRTLEEILSQCKNLTGPVELQPFTPMDAECEPQIDDCDDEGYEDESDDDDDDADEEDDNEEEETIDLETDEALNSSSLQPLALTPPPSYSGVILKRNRRGNRGWVEKWFILDGDQLHYTDRCPSKTSTVNRRTSNSEMVSSLSLRECRIWKTMEMPELCFNVINSNWKIKRELQALNKQDLENWMELINQGIDYANDTMVVHRKTEGSGARYSNATTVSSSNSNSKQSNDSDQRRTKKKKPSETRRAEPAEDDGAVPSAEDESDEVYQWLKEIGLQRYTSTLKAKGFASLDFIRETGIEKEDLNFLGIKDTSARKAITAAARLLRHGD